MSIPISFQARIKQDCQCFSSTKQESGKTTVNNKASIKIETRVLTPKSLTSSISSKLCSSLSHSHFKIIPLSQISSLKSRFQATFLKFLLKWPKKLQNRHICAWFMTKKSSFRTFYACTTCRFFRTNVQVKGTISIY